MTVHLTKMAVGVDDMRHLAEIQARRLERAITNGEAPELRHITRHTPRRAAEIEDGGSIYWVIKGAVRVRQRIVRVDRMESPEGGSACALVLDPQLVVTEARNCRPFQGWRYLEAANIPRDAAAMEGAGDMPPELASELKGLGLL
ncbi:MAG: DUF1489 domain-containing protein [Rhodospirillales bacterium]